MRRDLTRRAAGRAASLAMAIGLAATLQACTTIEGTNAMTDFGTFEREVMTSTLQGAGIVDAPAKKEAATNHRAPLALPKTTEVLPAPQTSNVADALPKNSDTVQIDATGLTEEDIKRLRRARVVDLRSISGRPLTEAEARQLTARMTAARVGTSERSLIIPPDEYFTTVQGQDYVGLAANGELVPVSDPACPPSIKKALGAG
jgi:hypothetical protein